MDINFSDEDLRSTPTKLQKAIMDNHEDIGDYGEVLYLKDGITVLFECSDGYIAVKPQGMNLN